MTLGDVAQVKPTFKDATSITRVNGRPAMTIEVSKRTGANLIETVDGVKYVVERAARRPGRKRVQVTFTQDKSKIIRQMLGDLQNSVATGVLLVAVIILFALGFRASLFIGIAIPASFLAGVLGLQLAGLTVNIVVLFSLILAVGMLVDDAIIVSEFAERRMAEGMPPKEAYSLAAKRMAGPGDRRDRDARRRLLAAAVLAGHRRRVHEIPADHADRDAVGVARGGAVLHADARRAARPGRGGAARRARHASAASTCAPCGSRCAVPARRWLLAVVLLIARAGRLRQVRPRRRVLPRASSPTTAR